ncbi:MAG TPA: hypothetical protein VF715_09910 [Thermoleophilaceae bacterium]
MARRSLKPQLNQIRSWVQQGRTDAWIAHQLDVSVGDLVAFKREHELAPPEADPENGDGARGPVADEEQDLREQDEALIAAALDAEPEETDEDEDGEEGEDKDGDDSGEERPRRRRGRRGGRARRGGRKRALEGTFDHGEEGYGLWLDPAVQDDPVYAEHWAGHRPVTVSVERDQIVIRRAGADGSPESSGDSGEDAADAGAPSGDGVAAGDSGAASGDAASGDGGEPAGPDPDAFDA